MLPTSLVAQNYKPTVEGQESYYIKPDGEIKGIKTNQVSISGNDTILNNFHTFKYDTSYCPPDFKSGSIHASNAYSPSWLGKDIILKPNGEVNLTNHDDEIITLHTWAGYGTSWNAFDLQGGNYIEASVTSITQSNVLGNIDSIKTIALQAKNNQGTNISHPINGSEIKLGKNSGFVQLFSFLEFPDNTDSYIITDQTKLARRDVYDFNIGDVIQVKIEDYYGGQPFDTLAYVTKTILSKTYSQGQETVEYSIQQDYLIYRSYYDYQNTHQTVYLPQETYSETVTVMYDSLSSYIDENMPEEVGFKYWPTNNKDYPYYYHLFAPDTICSRVSMELYNLLGFIDNTQPDTCWYQHLDGETPITVYIKELGEYRHEYGNFHQYHETPIYYKQGGEICGSLVTGTKEQVPPLEIQISIYPNPASNELNIMLTQPILDATLNIYDTVGKLVLSKQNVNGNQLRFDLGLESGVYFVHVSAKNHKTFARKIIVR